MTMYSRQTALNLKRFHSVAVVGVGGVGSWVALFEAMSGTNKIYIADGDVLEVSNLNRLPFQGRRLGMRKTEVVQKWIQEHIIRTRPDCEVITLPRLDDTTIEMLKNVNVIYDCTDVHSVQVMINEFCIKNHIRYYHPGYNGEHVTVTTDSINVWGEGEDGYTVVPSFIAPTVTVAALAVHAAHLGLTDIDFNMNLTELLDAEWADGEPGEEVKEEEDDAFGNDEEGDEEEEESPRPTTEEDMQRVVGAYREAYGDHWQTELRAHLEVGRNEARLTGQRVPPIPSFPPSPPGPSYREEYIEDADDTDFASEMERARTEEERRDEDVQD